MSNTVYSVYFVLFIRYYYIIALHARIKHLIDATKINKRHHRLLSICIYTCLYHSYTSSYI